MQTIVNNLLPNIKKNNFPQPRYFLILREMLLQKLRLLPGGVGGGNRVNNFYVKE